MITEDKHLLDIYMDGFNDETLDKFFNTYENATECYAYNLGGDHASASGDPYKLDLLTDEIIVSQIKRIK